MLYPPGDLLLIDDQLLTASAASFTVNPPGGAAKAVMLMWAARCDGGPQYQNLKVQFNGDAGANYDWVHEQTSGAANSAPAGGLADASFRPGFVSGGGSPAGSVGAGTLIIHDPFSTTLHKAYEGNYWVKLTDALGSLFIGNVGGIWKNTAAISSILFGVPAGRVFVAGSRLTTYLVL